MSQQSQINNLGNRYTSDTVNTIDADLTTAENLITVNIADIGNLQNSYVAEILTGNWISGDITTAVDIQFARYNDLITFKCDIASGTNGGAASPSFDYDTVVSATFRPSLTLQFNIISTNNATAEQGVCTIDSAGNIKVFRDIDQTTDFGTAVVSGFQSFGHAYNIEV